MEISVLKPNHKCTGINKVINYTASANWIVRNVLPNVKANPNITPKDVTGIIQQKFQQKFGLFVTYNKAWRGVQIAKETSYENVEESYNLADALRDELLGS